MKTIKCFKCKVDNEFKKTRNHPETYTCRKCGFEHRIDRVSLLSSFEKIRDNEIEKGHPAMVWNDCSGQFSIQTKPFHRKKADHIVFDDIQTVKTTFGLSEHEDVASAISGLDWHYIFEHMIFHDDHFLNDTSSDDHFSNDPSSRVQKK